MNWEHMEGSGSGLF